jgi:hypothetical protein
LIPSQSPVTWKWTFRIKLLGDMVVAEGAPTIGMALAAPHLAAATMPVYVALR